MTVAEILNELEKYGDEATRKTYLKHGAHDPLFGVKVADLKTILKKTKRIMSYRWDFIKPGIQMPCIWRP
jgi:hypothetical protein